jgi:hypothetical protein
VLLLLLLMPPPEWLQLTRPQQYARGNINSSQIQCHQQTKSVQTFVASYLTISGSTGCSWMRLMILVLASLPASVTAAMVLPILVGSWVLSRVLEAMEGQRFVMKEVRGLLNEGTGDM